MRLQVKWNQLSSNNLTIAVVYIRGRMLGSDLTQWPPNQILSVHWDTTGQTALEDHWSHKYTGMPLEPHWLMLAPSGVPVLICIIGTHWKTTGATSTLACHWNHTGWCLHPVVSQWRSSVNLHNWNTLEDHWKHTGISPVAFQCTLGSKFQAHWIATGRPLAQGKGCQKWCMNYHPLLRLRSWNNGMRCMSLYMLTMQSINVKISPVHLTGTDTNTTKRIPIQIKPKFSNLKHHLRNWIKPQTIYPHSPPKTRQIFSLLTKCNYPARSHPSVTLNHGRNRHMWYM